MEKLKANASQKQTANGSQSDFSRPLTGYELNVSLRVLKWACANNEQNSETQQYRA